VYGLGQVDLDLLDVFEGDVSRFTRMADGLRTPNNCPQEYKRELVKVYPLAPAQPLSIADGDDICESFDLPSEFNHAVNTHTYVWAKGIGTLEPKIWSYEVFVREKLSRWLEGEGGKNYEEVDAQRAQAALSTTTATVPQSNEVAEAKFEQIEQEKKDEFVFGREMRKWFGMDPNYINLNNG
jgi:hercynylcysteine S-oxide lyase